MADPASSAGDGHPETSSEDQSAESPAVAMAGSAEEPDSVSEPRDSSLEGEPAEEPRPRARDDSGSRDEGTLAFVRELPVLLLVAFVLALVIKTFLMQAFYIPSESMEPTLNVGDRVLVNKAVYHLHPPRRGDIIVFSDPHPALHPARNPISAFLHWLTEGLGVSTSPDKDFIKRVIGLPGDQVEIHRGVVYIDGKALKEPYLPASAGQVADFGPIKVPAGKLFVMGDNRLNSNDSRFQLGYIPLDKVIGRAFIVIWPPSRVGLLHGL